MSSTFSSLGVPADLAQALSERGMRDPFPIQAATLPDSLAGNDVCGQAPTGSGKTLAFGIPLMARVGRARPNHPTGLVLVPTRELAAQIAGELVALGGKKGPRIATFYGAVGFGGQLTALRRGVDIAVACPGRLTDLIDRGAVHLDEVKMVVLDEADRMADMGFLPVVRKLLDKIPSERQTLLFSATLDGDVDVLIRRYQRSPKRHVLEGSSEAVGQRRHIFWRTDTSNRVGLTAQVVDAHYSAMVFCRTKRGADRLARQLGQVGLSTVALHGDRTQAQRDRALSAFRDGQVQVLVATDVAARGIHVDDVGCVVHFDLPADHKDYVHRSGRTGRAGGNGTVVALVPEDRLGEARKLQRTLGLDEGVHSPDISVLSTGSTPRASRIGTPRSSSDTNSSRSDNSANSSHKGRPNNSRRGAPRGRSNSSDRSRNSSRSTQSAAGRPVGRSRRGSPSGLRKAS